MRLWHKELIPYLPTKQLLGQWRECCSVAKNVATKGTPNHILVNKVMNYPAAHFNIYALAICDEMRSRGYKCDFAKFQQWWINKNREWYLEEIFSEWHDNRYLRQCLYNLEEKAMCGGIPEDEWKIITDKYGKEFDLWQP